jgi:hypothetical protein
MPTGRVANIVPVDNIDRVTAPIRRMCQWIVDEECDPAVVVPLWQLTTA